LLTFLISIGGIGVVAATAVVEAVGGGQPTVASIDVTLFALAGVLLVAGIVTLAFEGWRLRAAAQAGTEPTEAAEQAEPTEPPAR
jgi:hypothetical protein